MKCPIIILLSLFLYSNSFLTNTGHGQDVNSMEGFQQCLEDSFNEGHLDKEKYENCKDTAYGIPEKVRTVFKNNLNQIRHCYEKELQKEITTRGRVKVRFSIGPNGHPSNVKVIANSTGSVELGQCVTRKILSWKFGPPAIGDKTDLTMPFRFQMSHPQNASVYVPIYSLNERNESQGTASMSLGLGKFNSSGDYKPRIVNPSMGMFVELGTKNGKHNFVMVIQGADTKQGEGTRHRFQSDTRYVSLGYISGLYRYCIYWEMDFRLCAATGLGILELTQKREFSDEMEGPDDRLLGAIPIQLAIGKTWFMKSIPQGTTMGGELMLTADYLQTQGIKFSSLMISYGIRFFDTPGN